MFSFSFYSIYALSLFPKNVRFFSFFFSCCIQECSSSFSSFFLSFSIVLSSSFLFFFFFIKSLIHYFFNLISASFCLYLDIVTMGSFTLIYSISNKYFHQQAIQNRVHKFFGTYEIRSDFAHILPNLPSPVSKYPLQHNSLASCQTPKILNPIPGGPSQPGLATNQYLKSQPILRGIYKNAGLASNQFLKFSTHSLGNSQNASNFHNFFNIEPIPQS